MAVKSMRWLEMAVALAIIATLYGVLSSKLEVLGESAERAAMQGVLGQLKQQLNMKIAKRYIQGSRDLTPLATENPFTWLAAPPENYRGELDSLTAILDRSEVEVWFFNSQSHELVYKVNRHQFLKIGDENQQILRFVLNLNQLTADKQSKAEAVTSMTYQGVFNTVVPFTWQIDTAL